MADKIYFDSHCSCPSSAPGPDQSAVQRPQAASFGDMLSAAKRQVAFSAHAKARLAERGISLSEQTLARLGTAIDQLAGKGARESLVYLDGTAFVVSVPKRTVITAMDGRTNDNIITNIDSAAFNSLELDLRETPGRRTTDAPHTHSFASRWRGKKGSTLS